MPHEIEQKMQGAIALGRSLRGVLSLLSQMSRISHEGGSGFGGTRSGGLAEE